MQKCLCLLLLSLYVQPGLARNDLNIAVASNMSHSITEIADSFREETGINVNLTFGSSGNFARQIIQGAPFKLFLSADQKYVKLLRENEIKLLYDIEYASGRIGLFIPINSSMSDIDDLETAVKKLIFGNYKRLVIANPEHAPYGIAAQQALQSAGLWVVEQQRLLLAENAAQATQIVLSGNVDAGIIPASYTYLPKLLDRGKFFLIPEQWHTPLQQHLVLLDGANNLEKQFFDYLQNKKSQLIIQNYGYKATFLNQQKRVYGLASP